MVTFKLLSKSQKAQYIVSAKAVSGHIVVLFGKYAFAKNPPFLFIGREIRKKISCVCG
jgi:hypothetical protein